jgi:hypothetical protein
MVDRAARDRAAGLVAAFRDGRIGSGEFNNGWPHESADPAVWQIFQTLCFSCEELRENKTADKREPSPAQRELFDRCVLFLLSRFEYAWPAQNVYARVFWGLLISIICFAGFIVFWGQGVLSVVVSLLVFTGLWVACFYLMQRSIVQHGSKADYDHQVWPFPHRETYEDALREAAWRESLPDIS